MSNVDAKTGVAEKIAERIATELYGPNSQYSAMAALIREELLGSELVKAAEPFTSCQMAGAIDTRICDDYQSAREKEPLLKGWKCKGCRLRAALNALREGKNG